MSKPKSIIEARQAVEDAAENFLTVVNYRNRGKREEQVKKWLVTALDNLVDYVRKERSQ